MIPNYGWFRRYTRVFLHTVEEKMLEDFHDFGSSWLSSCSIDALQITLATLRWALSSGRQGIWGIPVHLSRLLMRSPEYSSSRSHLIFRSFWGAGAGRMVAYLKPLRQFGMSGNRYAPKYAVYAIEYVGQR